MSDRMGSAERWVPGVHAARTYQRRWLRPDLVTGVVLAAILVPQQASPSRWQLPAVTGLYTTIGCLVGYTILGPSRILVLGPDSSVSPAGTASTRIATGGSAPASSSSAGRLRSSSPTAAFPPAVRRLVRRRQAERGSSSSARRSPTST